MLLASESLPAGADGATIPQWNDTSGNNSHVANITDANRPTLATDGGFRCANFASASLQALQLPAIAANVARNRLGLSALAVIRPATLHTGRIFYNASGAGAARLDCYVLSTGRFQIGSRRLDADTIANLQSAVAYTAAEKFIVRFVFNFGGALASVFKNGAASLAPAAWQSAGSTSDTPSASPYGYIGGPSSSFFNGRIFDFLVWEWSGGDPFGPLLDRYYGSKHGIAVA